MEDSNILCFESQMNDIDQLSYYDLVSTFVDHEHL